MNNKKFNIGLGFMFTPFKIKDKSGKTKEITLDHRANIIKVKRTAYTSFVIKNAPLIYVSLN